MSEGQDPKVVKREFERLKVTCTLGDTVTRQDPTETGKTIQITPFQVNIQAHFTNHYPLGQVKSFEWPLTPKTVAAMNNFGSQFASANGVDPKTVKDAVKQALREMDVSPVQTACAKPADEPLTDEELKEYLDK